jgi:hypothetical protein
VLASCEVLGPAPTLGALDAVLDAINEAVQAQPTISDPPVLAVQLDPQSGLPEYIVTAATQLRFCKTPPPPRLVVAMGTSTRALSVTCRGLCIFRM